MKCVLAVLAAVLLIAGFYPGHIRAEEEGSAPELRWQWAYDEAGRVASTTDPGGRRTTFTYEMDGKEWVTSVSRETADGSRVTWTLDKLGRLARMTDGAGGVAWRYDAVGRPVSVERSGRVPVTYAYDTLDRVKQVRVGDEYEIGYDYDFLGRIRSVKTPVGVVTYEYLTGQGIVIRKLPNRIETTWHYDPSGALRRIVHGGADRTLIAEYTYQYRPDGLLSEVRERTQRDDLVLKYTYDRTGRLVGVARAGKYERGYAYDEIGTRTQATHNSKTEQSGQGDWAGRLTSLNDKPCEHDAAGNLTAATPAGGARRFAFDSLNRLRSANEGAVTYKYDGDGNLIARVAGDLRTEYVNDPGSDTFRPLLATRAGGKPRLFVWEGNAPLMVIEDGRATYFLEDRLESARTVVGPGGRVEHRYYTPFGVGPRLPTGGDLTPGFAGLLWDGAAHVYLTRARAYSPELGRFLQTDPQHRLPTGSQKNMSLYAYCGGDPVNFVDRDGAEPQRSASGLNRWLDDRIKWLPRWRQMSWRQRFEDFKQAARTGRLVGTRHGEAATKFYADQYVRTGNRAWAIPGAFSALWTEKNFAKTGLTLIGGAAASGWAASTGPTIAQLPALAASAHAVAKVKILTLADPIKAAFLARAASKARGNEPLHFPLLPDWIRTQSFNPHWGVNQFGAHVRLLGNFHAYRDYMWWGKTFGKVYYHQIVNRLPSIPWAMVPAAVDAVKAKAGQAWRGFNNWMVGSAEGSEPPIGTMDMGRTMSPSPVGGVYLGGAGRALDGLGQLNGVALDAKGNLVLVAKGDGAVKLPPLRLDDVVTVFRTVYREGHGPTVTINPVRENPRGPHMDIVHGPGTEDTYVGWVLFEADRLMKGYSLGEDNVTKGKITTAIPGYADVLEKIYFGGVSPGELQKKGNWERFWIVPAGARRYPSRTRELTLLDVPLKVLTQKMKWVDGDFKDDPQGKSSPGALAFTDWFTSNYGAIAAERLLPPPAGAGLTDPVCVFSELQRIALITAIAEKLREQRVPMPAWMRNHEIARVSMDSTTPSHTVLREKETEKSRTKARIYGGVKLSPPDAEVRDLETPADVRSLPQSEQPAARENLELAASLEDVVRESSLSARLLEPLAVRHDDRDYRIVTMPGAGTRDLAPCRLAEADLVVPVPGGRSIRLVRSHHSFFRSSGPWGDGWVLDLPRLEKVRVPVSRGRDSTEYQIVDELVTPFNTLYARFGRTRAVRALGGSRLPVPDRECGILALADDQAEFLTVPTTVAFLKNGDRWHFTKLAKKESWRSRRAGRLLAVEKGGFRTVYTRDGKGRVNRIVGLIGDGVDREIVLRYSANGRLASAEGRLGDDRASVYYTYSTDGKLTGVRSEAGARGYLYEGPWVAAVTWHEAAEGGERVLRSFRYNTKGQLLAETDAEGRVVSYAPTSDTDGYSLTVKDSADPAGTSSTRFDNNGRPLEARLNNGTVARWTYSGGGAGLQVSTATGASARLTESADGRRRVLELPDLPAISGDYDDIGRLVSMARNGETLVRQHWQADGRLERVEDEGVTVWQEYAEGGRLAALMAAPPGQSGQFDEWRKTRLDAAGRPVRITDYRGLDITIGYDASGVSAILSKRDGKNFGVTIDRDASGRVRTAKSSWGVESCTYDAAGALTRLSIERQGETSNVRYENGQVGSVTHFDGGRTEIGYHREGACKGLPERVSRTNGPTIRYGYDSSARLSEAAIGTKSRVSMKYDEHGRVSSYAWRPPETAK